MTPPATSPAAPVDTSAEAVAAMVQRLRSFVIASRLDELREAAATLAAVVKERDDARVAVSASDAANQIGGLVGASAHDMHLDMERRLAEDVVTWKARADTASRQLAEARAVIFAEVAAEARRYAGHYPQSSDGRNTFILFAEWAEARALLSGETTI